MRATPPVVSVALIVASYGAGTGGSLRWVTRPGSAVPAPSGRSPGVHPETGQSAVREAG